MGVGYSGGIGELLRGPYPDPKFPRKKFMYKRFELFPIIAIVIAKFIFDAAAAVYMYNTRDYAIDRSKKPINEQMDLLKPYFLKLIVINEVLEPAVELHEAYEAMKEEEKRREEEKDE